MVTIQSVIVEAKKMGGSYGHEKAYLNATIMYVQKNIKFQSQVQKPKRKNENEKKKKVT